MAKMEPIDLRNEYALLQSQFCYDILYSRTAKHLKCQCFDTVYQSGDSRCPVCHGNGYVTSLERLSVIPEEGSKHGVYRMSFGDYAYDTKTFYFNYKATPQTKDTIIETAWTEKGFPVNTKAVYEIQYVFPVRGDRGRVELYKVEAKLMPERYADTHRQLNRLSKSAKQTLASGKRYLWPIIKK